MRTAAGLRGASRLMFRGMNKSGKALAVVEARTVGNPVDVVI
jgi:hypothetical protein